MGSFYTVSHQRFLRQWSLWSQNLSSVKPYYAVKCNTDRNLLQWLHKHGAGFDCASSQEMDLVSKMYNGPLQKEILFANPCKTQRDIQVAKDYGVSWVTVDSVEELEKMKKEEYTPELIIRLRVDDKGSTSPFAAKFGACSEITKEITRAAKDFQMPIVGLSFHIGSGSERPEAFYNAIIHSSNIWNTMFTKKVMNVLDIGGGWSHHPKLFGDQAYQSRKALAYCSAEKVIAEPGRFFAAPLYSLYVRVIGKKPYGNGWRYTLDESIYGQFSCIPYDHAKPSMGLLYSNGNAKKTKAILFGRTCDSLDWIANSISMETMNVGDWLYIPNMGAYTTATSTEFNGFPKPVIIESDEVPQDVRWLQLTYPLANMLSVKDAEQDVFVEDTKKTIDSTFLVHARRPSELNLGNNVYDWTVQH